MRSSSATSSSLTDASPTAISARAASATSCTRGLAAGAGHGGDRDDAGDVVAARAGQYGERRAEANTGEHDALRAVCAGELARVVDRLQPRVDAAGLEIVAAAVAGAVEIAAYGDDAGARGRVGERAHRAVRADRLVAERRHDDERGAGARLGGGMQPAEARARRRRKEAAARSRRDRGCSCWGPFDHPAGTSKRSVRSLLSAVTVPRVPPRIAIVRV